ncbi:MAG TPA: hypothetical protein VEC60_18995 [Reyranella sp.]|nr:hypothetical protein [Reyranella sp.]
MFRLAYDRRHKILLAQVSGVFGSSDVAALENAVARFSARHGPAHGLMDFTSVSAVAVPIGRLVQQAAPTVNGAGYRRVVVIANSELLELARTAVREPAIAGSMAEALRQLGAVSPSFEPVEP